MQGDSHKLKKKNESLSSFSFLRKSSSSSEIARVLSERWHVEAGKTKRRGVKHDASVSREVVKQSATGRYSDRESRNYDF